jgi:putative nucleotidyltransferase with HDIG domain
MLRFTRERDYLHPPVIWLVLVVWFLIFADTFFFSAQIRLENFIAEQSFWFFNQMPREAKKIAIVAIDEQSRHELNQKWPWKRSLTAKLIRNIASFSPKVIGLDIVFSGKSDEQEDKALVSALETHPKVVLGYVLHRNSEQKPFKDFIDATSSIGFVNKPTRASVVDTTRVFYTSDRKEPALSLEAEVLLAYLGVDRSRIKVKKQGVFLGDQLLIPCRGGITPLNYLVHPSHFTTIPASLVLKREVSPLVLKERIVLVGVTDPLVHDMHPTPMGYWPGVTIIGNSLAMMLAKRFVYTASKSQNLLFVFILGYLILLLNRRPRFLLNTVSAAFLLLLTYFSFLYLRARGIHFSYLAILFSGTAAYIVPNLYRYLNLLYLSNRLKTLAITDPLTGFYSIRYFLLQLDHRLKSRENLAFVGLRIGNYRELTLRLTFEQIKRLTGLFAGDLKSRVKDRFKKPVFSRIANDTFALIIHESAAEEIESFLREWLEKTKGRDWELGGKSASISLKGCVISRSREERATSARVIDQMESMFKRTAQDQILCEDLKGTGHEEERKGDKDILEFIAYDWEERNKDLEKGLREILEANKKLDALSWGTLNALARAIDANSKWTAGHSERVTRLALKMGRLLDMSQEELDGLHRAALLHDVGKIGMPPELLDKTDRLTEDEYQLVREHPIIGARILEPIDAYAEIIPIVRQHHEWFNGAGYPEGLAGESITLGARILAVADVYDALSSERPYRPSMEKGQALDLIKERSGTHFDPLIVKVFFKVIKSEGVAQHTPTKLPRRSRTAP